MEIAVEKDNFEVFIVLAGFAEVSADKKVDFLRMILEDKGHKQIATPCEYVEEFKNNLEGLSISEVLEKQLSMGWHLASDLTMNVNMIQFAAARGRSDLLQLLLDHGGDPEAHQEDTPRAVELAAVNGRIETFAALAAHLQIDSDDEWFQLAQLLVWGMSGDGPNHCHGWKASEEFKELLGNIPPSKVSKASVCGSTLLQDFAWCGNRSAGALLLQHGADPIATTAKNPKLPERWAYEHNHFGVLVELSKVKEVDPEIMLSSLGELVLKEEERECRRRREKEEKEWRRRRAEEEGEWRRKMLEQCTSAIQQQQDWQKEVVGMFKQQNQLISLLARNSSVADQEQDNDANIFNPII